MSEPSFSGGCLCGQVRFVGRGQPANVRACHCSLCRKATGGPFFARAVFLRENLERTGETTRFASSHRLERCSCVRCGTPVFSEPLDMPNRIGVLLPTLDDPNALSPSMHIWISAKLDWVTIPEGVPQYAEGPPA